MNVDRGRDFGYDRHMEIPGRQKDGKQGEKKKKEKTAVGHPGRSVSTGEKTNEEATP
ncbi:MAG: hypothetical protein IKP22_11425 [Clostridia bacterium]|nr:hypothetical protein [Clostridia bacterium]